jgi:hypothetical protein
MTDRDEAEQEIRRIAHDLWLKEGRPDGQERRHWDAAKEIWAYRKGLEGTMAPSADMDASEPFLAVENQAVLPELTDQAEDTQTPRRRTASMPLTPPR